MTNSAELILENGNIFEGIAPHWYQGKTFGEVVFTTGMTGYPESLSDPSYAGQILVFTYPLIGNYGVPPPEKWESTKIHLQGVIVSETCLNWSHHEGINSLLEWFEAQKIPVIAGLDTRALTKMLRSSGTLRGVITTEKSKIDQFPNDDHEHLVAKVSPRVHTSYPNGQKLVIAVDCGMKENIIRSLCRFPVHIKRVPHSYDYTQEEYDGVFLSNGPGDPQRCSETIAILKKALQKDKPIFGICLGTQLLALAAGATTYKLPFGHRGQNQPCIELESKRCYITSQNHGYAVEEKSLPKEWKTLFRNLNDGSVEGIAHKTKPYFAVQFHPEATPGPTDTQWLFEKFYKML